MRPHNYLPRRLAVAAIFGSIGVAIVFHAIPLSDFAPAGSQSGNPVQPVKECDPVVVSFQCAEGLPGTEALKPDDYLRQLEQWASRVRSETDRHFHRFRGNPAEYENSEGFFRMLMMAVVLAEDFGVRYNPARMGQPSEASAGDGFFSDPSDVFIHGLLGPKRMGTCSSMPVLYLALGRRLGYPLKLVTTKGHLFVRWEGRAEPGSLTRPSGTLSPSGGEGRGEEAGAYERFNIEVTGRGVNQHDDEHYRHWPFDLTDEEIAENGYLKSLTPDEEHAVFLTIRAECLKEARRHDEAVTAYKEAVRLAPHVRAYRLLLADTERQSRENLKPAATPPPNGALAASKSSLPGTETKKGNTP